MSCGMPSTARESHAQHGHPLGRYFWSAILQRRYTRWSCPPRKIIIKGNQPRCFDSRLAASFAHALSSRRTFGNALHEDIILWAQPLFMMGARLVQAGELLT